VSGCGSSPGTRPSTPGTGAAANPSAPAAGKQPCNPCSYWNQNHVVDYNGPDSKFVTSTQIAATNIAFRLEANLAGRSITITSIFKWGTIAPRMKKTKAKKLKVRKDFTIKMFKAKAASWSGKFKMKITDPVCGEKTLPIRFRVLWSPDDTGDPAPFQVNLHRTYPRAGVTGWDIDIGYLSDVVPNAGWVLAHEYGHTFCLPDEYFYAGVTSATVVYKKADGSQETVKLEPKHGNIMFKHGDTHYLKRFYYFAAIQAQEVLRAKSGHSVKCKIV
jgi:hypothetical protein